MKYEIKVRTLCLTQNKISADLCYSNSLSLANSPPLLSPLSSLVFMAGGGIGA